MKINTFLSNMKVNSSKKGFTLIELLVVIAIIGILAALVIVSLSGARSKAQDTQRKNNARNLDSALAQYYLDQVSPEYPASAGSAAANGVAMTNNTTCPAPLDGLVGTGKYLTTDSACTDPGSLMHRYMTDAASAATSYTIVWQLSNQSEGTVTSGNGVYTVASGVVDTPKQDATAASGIAGTRAFVVYGPQ